MDVPLDLLQRIAAAAASASLAATLTSLLVARRSAKAKLRAAADMRLQQVLESGDLRDVGCYLDEVVGNFCVREYVSDSQVARTVDAYVARLEAFVGTDAGMAKQLADAAHPPEAAQPLPLPAELQKALETLRSGEPWNALARVRRYLEMTLRQMARQVAVTSDRPLSAGQLVNLLSRKELLPPHAQESLRYAIAVCNKAIHGLDVTAQEAEDALFHAAAAIHALQDQGAEDGAKAVPGGPPAAEAQC